jgi:hypothetical protein
MTVPPWKTPEGEQEAFISFVIAKLDEEDDRLAERFARMWIERSADADWASKAREQFEAERLARKHGGVITWPEDTKAPHRPKATGPFARAKRDVRRIQSIFKRYWPDNKKRNDPPTAEQIAAIRWNLSNDEATRLHKVIQRP